MPIDSIAQPLLNLQGQVINAISTKQQNKKTRQWNEKMYNLQRQHALEDWARQTEYDHPSAQMARLREANLNPALMYKNGAGVDSPAVRASSVQSWNPDPIQFNTGSVLSQFMDMEMKQAQIDNARKVNTNLEIDGLLKMMGLTEKDLNIQAGQFDLGLKKELRETTVEAATASLKKLLADTEVMLNRDEREAALNAKSVEKAAEEILSLRLSRAKTQEEINHIRQQIKNLKADETLKKMDIELRRLGIMPGDPMWARILGRIVNTGILPEGATLPGSKKVGNSISGTYLQGAKRLKSIFKH